MAVTAVPKKSNQLILLDSFSADTVVIIGGLESGSYFGCLLSDFVNYFNKETIAFEDQDTIEIAFTTERKLKFGNALVITAELLTEENIYRQVSVEIQVDSITLPTTYTIKLGGVSTGRIIIS